MNGDLLSHPPMPWFATQAPTVRAVVEHARSLVAADRAIPVILSADGHVLDGMHRIASALLHGEATVPARRLSIDPTPDWLRADRPRAEERRETRTLLPTGMSPSTVRGVPDHEEIVRQYGPWRSRTPDDVADLLAGYDGRWWIAGGWAIEAFTGVPRPHDDVDPSIPRSDVHRLRHHVSGRLDVWQADDGALRPLVNTMDSLPETCENLWLRRSGPDPWEYDVILMGATATTWTYKRDSRISLPVDEILWEREGINYLRPEVQLLHEAPGLRAEDQLDFDACAPLLDPTSRAWLRRALAITHPGHPWLARLQASAAIAQEHVDLEPSRIARASSRADHR